MEFLKQTVLGVLHGFKDSLVGIWAIRHFFIKADSLKSDQRYDTPKPESSSTSSKKKPLQQQHRKLNNAKNNILYCCCLNGVIFLLSIVLFDYILLPTLHLLVTLIFAENGGSSGNGSKIEFWNWFRAILSYIFNAFWILPIFLLSRIVNVFFFQEIADSAFHGRIRSLRSIPMLFADFFFSLFVQVLFLLQSMLIDCLPLSKFATIFSLIHISFLYSLYSFEYRWFNMGWELHRRLHFIESNWPYFLGFGIPLSILTSMFESFIVNGCIFSILFPLFIISSNEAKPKRDQNADNVVPSLPIFQPAVLFSNGFLRFVLFLCQTSGFFRKDVNVKTLPQKKPASPVVATTTTTTTTTAKITKKIN